MNKLQKKTLWVMVIFMIIIAFSFSLGSFLTKNSVNKECKLLEELGYTTQVMKDGMNIGCYVFMEDGSKISSMNFRENFNIYSNKEPLRKVKTNDQ